MELPATRKPAALRLFIGPRDVGDKTDLRSDPNRPLVQMHADRPRMDEPARASRPAVYQESLQPTFACKQRDSDLLQSTRSPIYR